MANPWLTSTLNEITQSHKIATISILDYIHQAAEQSRRAVQLWIQFVSLVDQEDLTGAGALVQQDATVSWNISKNHLATSLDAAAAAMGTTREDLLSQLSQVPQTNFNT
jgi:hypothetical protein